MKNLQIGLLGVGAIGTTIAFALDTKHHIKYYNRSARSVLSCWQVGEQQRRTVLLSNPQKAVVLDWLLICLKEYHYPAAAESLQQLIGPKTKVAVIRNGIDLTSPLLAYTTPSNILPCMIDCPVQPHAKGGYEQLRPAVLSVPVGVLADDLATLFLPAAIDLQQTEDFEMESWKKLIESSALGAVLALSGETCRIFEQPDIVKLYRQLVDEGIAVARAVGITIAANYRELLLQKLRSYPPNKGSSMLTDRNNGRPIEINAKNGIIARLGKAYGVPAERHEWATLLLGRINEFV